MDSSTPKKLSVDVLIIGAGGAGLRAAIEASNLKKNVLIVTKEALGGAHTSMAMGGINVAIKAPATVKQHFDDTIEGGWRINNYKLVDIFTKEMPERVYDLERFGTRFDRLPDGSFYTWAGGKQSAPLNLCAGDYTGREMMKGLVAEVKRLKIPVLEDYFVTKLFVENDKAIGAFVTNLKGTEYQAITAKATIVATGGGGMIYLINTNAPSNTGEGYAWALDAGCELLDMEMIQFHPTGMAYPQKKGTLVTEKVRGHGGILLNKLGERFMAKYQPKRMELAGRDEVSRAIYQEVKEGRGTENGGVYLDITHWKKGDVEKLVPDVFEHHMEIGIDIRKTPMEISPSMHHFMGGIRINEWTETNIKGLLACGEVAGGIHGANRLGGNSIAEGQVFGRRSGIRAAEYADKQQNSTLDESKIVTEIQNIKTLKERKQGVAVKTLLTKLQTIMWDEVGLVKNRESLERAQKAVNNLEKEAHNLYLEDTLDFQRALELPLMIKTAQSVIVAALVREESRGAHYRSDFPEMKDEWEKNILVSEADTKLITKIIPVVK